jgi:hypothetical protein
MHSHEEPKVPASFPQELLHSSRGFVQWSLRSAPSGKLAKRPHGSTLDPGQPFAALAHVLRSASGGIGLLTLGRVRVRGGVQILLDLDACVDRTGGIAPWAQAIVDYCGWFEVSPSGTGLHAAVICTDLPPVEQLRTLVNVDEKAPEGVTKKPQIQIFGTGPAGYVAVTFNTPEGTPNVLRELPLGWMFDKYGMRVHEPSTPISTGGEGGYGPAPSLDAIQAEVVVAPHGADLLDGHWQRFCPDRSASEGYYALTVLVLDAAHGHRRLAADFLLETAWGAGEIDGSRDPTRYMRRRKVEGEVARVAVKTGAGQLVQFPPLPTNGAVTGGGLSALPAAAKLLWTVPELLARGRPKLLWRGGFAQGSLGLWYGAPKTGKSYLALAFALAVAEGVRFLGHACRRGRVVYVAGEGSRGVADKVAAAIGPERAADPRDPVHEGLAVIERMPNLTNPKALGVVLAAIGATGFRADLVVIDTVARAVGAAGLDENDSADMNPFITAIDHLRAVTGAAVLGVHHAGKSGQYRGSSVLHASPELFARIERARPGVSRFEVEGQRDGEPGPPVEVTWGRRLVAVDADDGEIVRWCIESITEVDGGGAEIRTENKARSRIVELLQTSARGESSAEINAHVGDSPKQTRRLLEKMLEEGLLKRVNKGRATLYKLAFPGEDLM